MLPSTCAGMHAVTAQNADQRKWAERGRTAEEFSQRSPGYSKIANKLLGKWKWFCTSQARMQRCHIPLSVLAKHRRLENQVGKEHKLVGSSYSCTRINNKKSKSLLFLLKTLKDDKNTLKIDLCYKQMNFFSYISFGYRERFPTKLQDSGCSDSHCSSQAPIFSATSNSGCCASTLQTPQNSAMQQQVFIIPLQTPADRLEA